MEQYESKYHARLSRIVRESRQFFYNMHCRYEIEDEDDALFANRLKEAIGDAHDAGV